MVSKWQLVKVATDFRFSRHMRQPDRESQMSNMSYLSFQTELPHHRARQMIDCKKIPAVVGPSLSCYSVLSSPFPAVADLHLWEMRVGTSHWCQCACVQHASTDTLQVLLFTVSIWKVNQHILWARHHLWNNKTPYSKRKPNHFHAFTWGIK